MEIIKTYYEEGKHTDWENWQWDGWIVHELTDGRIIKTGCTPISEEKKEYKKIVFANCSIITTEGTFKKKKISLEKVKKLIFKTAHYESAIGHDSTAEILSNLVRITIPVNRIKYEQKEDELMIVFQLRDRPPEGKILSKEEIEEIGYDFFSIEKI